MSTTGLMIAVVFVVCLAVSEAIFTTSSCYYWSPWGPFSAQSECDVQCGSGLQKRERARFCRHPGYFPPPGCRYGEVERETTTCQAAAPCDGALGEWSEWSHSYCSTYCGEGNVDSTRTRSCTPHGHCFETLSETTKKPCVGQGGYCRYPCSNYRSFIYIFGKTTHVCLRGKYQPIECPAKNGDLLKTCGRDYVKCQVYYRIERYCSRNP